MSARWTISTARLTLSVKILMDLTNAFVTKVTLEMDIFVKTSMSVQNSRTNVQKIANALIQKYPGSKAAVLAQKYFQLASVADSTPTKP